MKPLLEVEVINRGVKVFSNKDNATLKGTIASDCHRTIKEKGFRSQKMSVIFFKK